MSAQILPFSRSTENPYRFGSIPWRIWNEGADATNQKWRLAMIGKLPQTEARDG